MYGLMNVLLYYFDFIQFKFNHFYTGLLIFFSLSFALSIALSLHRLPPSITFPLSPSFYLVIEHAIFNLCLRSIERLVINYYIPCI